MSVVMPDVLYRYMAGLATHDVDLVATTVADSLEFVAATRRLAKADFLAMLRALYTGFPDWRYEPEPPRYTGNAIDAVAIRWRQGGTHTGVFALPGLDPVAPTGRRVQIPPHDFFYRIEANRLVYIRPDPIPGGAPRGILEQIGVVLPPL